MLLQRRIAVAATLAVFELTAAKAHGQAIERNVAPGLQAPPAAVLVGPDLEPEQNMPTGLEPGGHQFYLKLGL